MGLGEARKALSRRMRSATAGGSRGRSLRVDRIVCAMLAAALHVGAAWCIDPAMVASSETITEQSTPERRAMLVTVFVSEDGGGAPRFAPLSAADLMNLPSAIVLPLPQLPGIRPIAADSFERAREIANNSEDIEKAQRLQGLYVGQIKARLLRLLESSRDSHAALNGHCVMYVVQNEHGQVLDVMSDECEGDAAWRRDVENAIRRASPLPLPPEGSRWGAISPSICLHCSERDDRYGLEGCIGSGQEDRGTAWQGQSWAVGRRRVANSARDQKPGWCWRNSSSCGVDARSRIALRCGNRPKRSTMTWCCRA